MNYGLQMYSVRDITEKDLAGALKKVATGRETFSAKCMWLLLSNQSAWTTVHYEFRLHPVREQDCLPLLMEPLVSILSPVR